MAFQWSNFSDDESLYGSEDGCCPNEFAAVMFDEYLSSKVWNDDEVGLEGGIFSHYLSDDEGCDFELDDCEEIIYLDTNGREVSKYEFMNYKALDRDPRVPLNRGAPRLEGTAKKLPAREVHAPAQAAAPTAASARFPARRPATTKMHFECPAKRSKRVTWATPLVSNQIKEKEGGEINTGGFFTAEVSTNCSGEEEKPHECTVCDSGEEDSASEGLGALKEREKEETAYLRDMGVVLEFIAVAMAPNRGRHNPNPLAPTAEDQDGFKEIIGDPLWDPSDDEMEAEDVGDPMWDAPNEDEGNTEKKGEPLGFRNDLPEWRRGVAPLEATQGRRTETIEEPWRGDVPFRVAKGRRTSGDEEKPPRRQPGKRRTPRKERKRRTPQNGRRRSGDCNLGFRRKSIAADSGHGAARKRQQTTLAGVMRRSPLKLVDGGGSRRRKSRIGPRYCGGVKRNRSGKKMKAKGKRRMVMGKVTREREERGKKPLIKKLLLHGSRGKKIKILSITHAESCLPKIFKRKLVKSEGCLGNLNNCFTGNAKWNIGACQNLLKRILMDLQPTAHIGDFENFLIGQKADFMRLTGNGIILLDKCEENLKGDMLRFDLKLDDYTIFGAYLDDDATKIDEKDIFTEVANDDVVMFTDVDNDDVARIYDSGVIIIQGESSLN